MRIWSCHTLESLCKMPLGQRISINITAESPPSRAAEWPRSSDQKGGIHNGRRTRDESSRRRIRCRCPGVIADPFGRLCLSRRELIGWGLWAECASSSGCRLRRRGKGRHTLSSSSQLPSTTFDFRIRKSIARPSVRMNAISRVGTARGTARKDRVYL